MGVAVVPSLQYRVCMSDTPAPPWKFWHPLRFWQLLVIAFAAQLICIFIVVALREGAHVAVPQWVAGGAGGLLMVVAVRALARRKLDRG